MNSTSSVISEEVGPCQYGDLAHTSGLLPPPQPFTTVESSVSVVMCEMLSMEPHNADQVAFQQHERTYAIYGTHHAWHWLMLMLANKNIYCAEF